MPLAQIPPCHFMAAPWVTAAGTDIAENKTKFDMSRLKHVTAPDGAPVLRLLPMLA